MMNREDVFVGGLAIVLGLLALVAAAGNWEWSFQLAKAQFFETRWGRGSARLFYLVLGIGLIAVGLLIATTKWRTRTTPRARRRAPTMQTSRTPLPCPGRPLATA